MNTNDFNKACQDPQFRAELESKLSECGPAPSPPKSVPEGVQGSDRGRVGAGGWAAWLPLIFNLVQQAMEEWKRRQSAEAGAEGGEAGRGEAGKGS